MFAELLRQVGGRLRRGAAARPDESDEGPQSLARAAIRAGSFERAIEILSPHVSGNDAPADALQLIGHALARTGRLEDARDSLFRSLARERSAGAHADLGNVQQLLGDAVAAEHEYRQSLAIDRAQPGVWYNLGVSLERKGASTEAADCLDEALSFERAPSEALSTYALLASKAPELWERLARHCDRTLEADSRHAIALEAIGFMRLKRDLDATGAVEAFEAAIDAGGTRPDLYGNLGIALQDLGRIPDALDAYGKALAAAPQNPLYRFHRSLALLLAGRFADAWPDYEVRLISEDTPRRQVPLARWDGNIPAEGDILIVAEQGLGDEIMFASCIPDLLGLGARCVIDCHPKLASLFARSFPSAAVRAGTQFEDLRWLREFPDLRVYVPAGSLPLQFRQSLADFPKHHGYLRADPAKVSKWRERLATLGPAPKLGISWRGGTVKTRRKLRSPGPDDLLVLLRQPGIDWVSLQYDATDDELRTLSAAAGVTIHHWTDAIADYDETAALLCSLELVVSVCTAVVHLGGALGRPVWVLAPFSPEWRYGLDREHMPWYPSVRVFRQPAPYEWRPLMERVRYALADWRQTRLM